MFHRGPRESWCRKGKIGAGRGEIKKKPIKNKILTSQPPLPLGACVALTSPAAAAVPALRSEVQCPIWEDMPKAGYGKRLFSNTDGLNLYSFLNYILMRWLLWRCQQGMLGLNRFGVSVPGASC